MGKCNDLSDFDEDCDDELDDWVRVSLKQHVLWCGHGLYWLVPTKRYQDS